MSSAIFHTLSSTLSAHVMMFVIAQANINEHFQNERVY